MPEYAKDEDVYVLLSEPGCDPTWCQAIILYQSDRAHGRIVYRVRLCRPFGRYISGDYIFVKPEQLHKC